jgi:hypothetical protein
VDKDCGAEEIIADEDISRIENLQKGLEVAKEHKQICTCMRKRKPELRVDEEETMEKVRHLRAHPQPRADADILDSPRGGEGT